MSGKTADTHAYDLLREVYFFKDLPDVEIKRLEGLCHEETFPAGEIIFVEGSRAEKFYIVLEGRVAVWKDYFDRERDQLAVHGKGHLFGEMAIIDDLPRSATVVAEDDTRVLFIMREDFLRLIQENTSIAISIMRSVSSMVRQSNESFVDGLRKQNRELEKAYRELKEAQAELLRAERLSTIGKFSSLILHDIRNPISVLKGFGELILYHLDDRDRTEKCAKNIIREAERLNRLAGELLDYSRGEIRLNISIVDLNRFFSHLLELISDKFEAKNMTVRVENSCAGQVLFDEDRMLRVLINLSDNARKAMKRGGSLTIRARQDGMTLLIEVRDDGVGMSDEVLAHLFEPFFSCSNMGGTGLGMLIVKNVVEAHEGTLEVESTENAGTTVRITLPLRS